MLEDGFSVPGGCRGQRALDVGQVCLAGDQASSPAEICRLQVEALEGDVYGADSPVTQCCHGWWLWVCTPEGLDVVCSGAAGPGFAPRWLEFTSPSAPPFTHL